MYPSKDGKLFATKEQRDAHNATLPTHDDEYIVYVPFSATRDLNESIRNGAAQLVTLSHRRLRWFSVAHCYTIQPVYYSMTTATMHTILDVEFDTDELKDIVMHGMSAGVSGFIYTRDNVKHFDDNEDEIEEFLSDWYHDVMGEDNYIHVMTEGHPEIASIDRLKEHMVWSYVELKAYDLLNEAGIEV